MSKVDWSLAPDWCNGHGYIGHTEFQVWFDAFSYQYVNSGKRYQFEEYENYELADICRITERPKQPQAWSGPEDGLPPVGTQCQMMENNSGPMNVEILMYRSGYVLVYCEDAIGPPFLVQLIEHSRFQPVKTLEQIRAEKRETAIRELMDIAQVDCRVTAARLVDAGFKREVV